MNGFAAALAPASYSRAVLLSHSPLPAEEWLGPESNRGHEDFQSSALPTELPSLTLLLRNLCGRVPIFQPRGAVKRFAIEGGDLPHDYFGRERSAAGITFRIASHSRDCVCHASHIGPL